MKSHQMWIGGKKVNAISGKTFKIINPATEEEIAEIPLADKADVDMAVEAARKAFPIWSKKTQTERSKIVHQIADLVKEHAQEFADINTMEHGNPTATAKRTVLGWASGLEYSADIARSFIGEVLPYDESGALSYYQREPIGVCALIIPWNAPLSLALDKLGPALAVGNACILKPPSINSMSILKLADILEQVDLPAGIVNIITGPGGTVGEALSAHPGIGMISFTGSTDAGKSIMSIGSQTVKRLTLELGGKNPFIVLEDADIDKAAKTGVSALLKNSGQICASPGRFYVNEKIYDKFTEMFVAEAKKIVTGDPSDPKTQMGPVVSAHQRDKIENYIKIGVKEGARLLLGGSRPTTPPLNKGFFVMPTVIADITQDMTLAKEEIFGPVGCIMKLPSDDQAVDMANDNTYGLAASVWTKDIAKAIKFANDIQAGTVWINGHITIRQDQPWGGFKQSGIGKERSRLGLEEYTQVKVITVNL